MRLGTKRLGAIVTASVLTSGMVAAGTGALAGGAASASARTSASAPITLTMESSPETSITDAFNPFLATDAPQGMGATGMIYEPLIQFDVAAPPKYYPWLATKYAWSNGGKSITFTIRQGVKWSNGTPMTAADVAFSYEMVAKNPSVNTGGLTISSVTTSGQNVTVNFPTAQYTKLQQIANVYIVPKSIWGSVNPGTYADANPVGTGPYMLEKFTPQGFTLEANPNYWQGKPKIEYLYFPVYTSNTDDLNALISGQAQWEGNYLPGLQKVFVDTSPQYHHYWMAHTGSVALVPNLTKWPTNQLAVREAISLAINRTTIGLEGEDGLEVALTNQSGLTLPTFAPWLAPAVKNLTLNPGSQVAAAKAVLEKAGYVMGKSGYFQTKAGKVISITLIDPAAYTDYAEDDQIVADELKLAGIQATFVGQGVTSWSTDVADGDFQMTMHWSNGGITPYAEYDGWLDSTLATASATGDYERLDSPAMDADLAKLAAAPTVAQQTAALAPIELYVAKNLPIIPVVSSAAWCEYNSTNIVGWPSPQNPYESCQPAAPTNEVVAIRLAPRS
jgi:peptide/nickel transport system substrate-binding protein